MLTIGLHELVPEDNFTFLVDNEDAEVGSVDDEIEQCAGIVGLGHALVNPVIVAVSLDGFEVFVENIT